MANERVFTESESYPTEEALQTAFGEAYNYYEKLMYTARSFLKEWNYSKNGWTLKVFNEKKALFYLIPFKNEFIISLTVRENERSSFLDDEELQMIHEMVDSAKKYSEGFALRFTVNNHEDFDIVELFIGKLILMR